MNRESFLPILDQALTFVRVHGWVDQTGDHISAVQAFFPEFPEQRREFSALLVERLTSSPGSAEKLFVLVCLRLLGMPQENLAELFLLHLAGKLEKRDQSTLQRYFFEGRNPLPLALSHEITDRVYLTHHRALYRALQMQSFSSECDGQDIILYFVQLLCRNDIFEQNRAMVHLLLSRIDAPVSAYVQAVVAEALASLGDLIAEVERQGASVLTETHYDDAPLGEQTRLPENQAPPPSKRPASGPREEGERLTAAPHGPLTGWSTVPRGLGTVDHPTKLPLTLRPVAPGTSPPHRSGAMPPGPRPRGASPERRDESWKGETGAFEWNLESAPAGPEVPQSPEEARKPPSPLTEVQGGPTALSPARYEIRFNRDSPELKTLLRALEPSSGEPQEPEEDQPPGGLEKAPTATLNAGLPRRSRLPCWGWLILLLVVAGALVYWGNQGTASPPEPPHASVTAPVAPVTTSGAPTRR